MTYIITGSKPGCGIKFVGEIELTLQKREPCCWLCKLGWFCQTIIQDS